MPTYDYLCEACGHTFELRQSFHDDPASTCTRCGGAVRRVFAPAPIIFKGSGWYVNDSKRPNAGLGTSKDRSGAGKDSSTGESAEKSTSNDGPSEKGGGGDGAGGESAKVKAEADSKTASNPRTSNASGDPG